MKDIDYMQRAFVLARKGKGRTSPNPMVGALLVKNKKYYVALVGKVNELLRAGYDQAQIMLTYGKGYFSRHEAYVIRSGPIPVEQAKREKIEHCVSPTPKKI